MLKSAKGELGLFKIWMIFFSYTALVSLLIKSIILPYVFPALYAGNGLAVGGDWIYFNSLAVELATKIKLLGWSAWQLRPGMIGQAPAGIAAAIYALTVPNSLMLIPLNSALHATGALALVLIIKIFIPDLRKAVYCALPFLLFPSPMLWYTQLHKDGYACAGILLFLLAWVTLSDNQVWERLDRKLFFALVNLILGAFLLWIVRPYEVRMMQGIAALFAIFLTVVFLFRALRKKIGWLKFFLVVLLFWGSVIVISPFTRESGNMHENIHRQVKLPEDIVTESKLEQAFTSGKENISEAHVSAMNENHNKGYIHLNIRDKNGGSEHLNASVANIPDHQVSNSVVKYPARRKKDNKIMVMIKTSLDSIAVVRVGSTSTYGKSGIDTNINFKSNRELIRYIPRAMQIVFLAPFPNQWFHSGAIPINTLMRRVSFLEMIIIYFGLFFSIFSIWYWKNRIELWMIVAFCSFMSLIYGLCIANVGTIYRIRYPFITTMLALGLAGFVRIREIFAKNKKSGQ